MTDTRELVKLVRVALTFCNVAAGEGLEIDGLSPEDFLMSYSDATGFEDWDRIGDHASDLITALAEENQRLREALKECEAEIDRYIWQEYPLDHQVHERYRQRDFVANPARAALSSTGKNG